MWCHFFCHLHSILACGQFILCPTELKSSNRTNCSYVPHIVNNSWGGKGGQGWFEDMISTWRAAGIHPFFANGNSGPKCQTTGSPADSDNVIAIGAVLLKKTIVWQTFPAAAQKLQRTIQPLLSSSAFWDGRKLLI